MNRPIPKLVLQTRHRLEGARDREAVSVKLSARFDVPQINAIDELADAMTSRWRETGVHLRATRSDALVELVEQYRRNPPQIQEPDAG